MANKIYKDTVGFLIRVDMQEAITAASSYSLRVKKPSGTTTTWTPYIAMSTEFRYVTIAGDLNESGVYIIQPYLTLGAWTGPGSPVRFTVVDPIL